MNKDGDEVGDLDASWKDWNEAYGQGFEALKFADAQWAVSNAAAGVDTGNAGYGNRLHPGARQSALSPITLERLMSLRLPTREFIIEPLIHERGLAMVYAWRGVGKTWFALGLAYA